MIKERDKFLSSNIFEGIVSFRAVINSMETCLSDRKIIKAYYDKTKLPAKAKEYSYISAMAHKYNFELLQVEKEKIDELSLGNNHGGLVFECSERTIQTFDGNIEENGFYVSFDGIEDPYNFGYALRTLYAAGIDGVILSPRNWMGAAGIVCRSSAGASETIKMYIDDGNAVKIMKEKGYKIVCADMENSKPMYEANLKKPLLLVVGGEKRGISKKISIYADEIVRIDYAREFNAALSAASAASVLGFEVYRQNR